MDGEILNLDDDLDMDSGVPAFNIQLAPSGDQGSGFHTQNDPKSPYQRERVLERPGAVDIRCSCVDIIDHCFWTPMTTPQL